MIHLTLRQLQMLEAVARCGSFSKASAELHLSQPAVSMQIRQLEESLDLPLFEQIGKKIYLTEAGRETLQAGQVIQQQLVNLETSLANLRGLKGGSLRISVASTVSYFSARLVALFREQYPDVRISLNVVNRETLLQHLLDNTIDLVLMGRPPEGYDVQAQPFMNNLLVVIAAPNHPLTGIKHISLSRLIQESFVAREMGSGTRSSVEAYFMSQGLVLKPAMEMNKNEAIKQAVEVGLGLGVVSIHTIGVELAMNRLCVLDVEGFPLQRKWFLVQREGRRLSPVAQTFADFVLSEAQRIAGSGEYPPPGFSA